MSPYDYLEPIASLGNERLVIFEGTLHSHHLEKTEEYLQVVRDFLKQVDEYCLKFMNRWRLNYVCDLRICLGKVGKCE